MSDATALQNLTKAEGRMSATGSFGPGDSFAMETTLVTGDTKVRAVGPLYQTVTDAGKSHAEYRAEEIPSGSPPAVKPHYTTPGESAEPNEYDTINERGLQCGGKGSSQTTPPQVGLHSEDVLYQDQASEAEELRHATPTMDRQKQKYPGGVSSGITYEPKEVKSTYCCGRSLVKIWMCFFVILALVLSIVALVFVIVIALGAHDIPCDCKDSNVQTVIQRLGVVGEDLEEKLDAMGEDINDVGYEIDMLEYAIEDVGEGIEDMETEVENVTAEVVNLREEVKTTRSVLQIGQQDIEKKMTQLVEEVTRDVIANHTENYVEVKEELASLQRDTNSTLYILQELKNQFITMRQDNFIHHQDFTSGSCSELHPTSPSGYYWLRGSPERVYCDMDRQSCGCGNPRGWMRVANIDMTDPNQQCPEGFGLRPGTLPRMCEMIADSSAGRCTSIYFPTHSVQYSRVCGMVRAYQFGTPDAFYSGTIDDQYVDGVSITHGQSPRKHIWTLAAAIDETRSTRGTCPCTKIDSTYTGVVPPFIGNDYFCDTGSRQEYAFRLYPDDPLWDGEGCGPTSSCCQFNSPPWFCKELPQPTTDDIELRVCRNEQRSNEDIPFEHVKLYIQ